MKRLIPLLILMVLFSSCRKSENDSLWEKSYGKGEAFFLRASADSGFAACGEIDGKPYFIRLSRNRNMVLEINPETQGLFSSAWFDTSGYISGGNSGGKMLLMHHSKNGNLLWEKSFDAGFKVDFTSLNYTGNGSLLAVGTASPDSSKSGATGLLFVRFDTTGQVITQNKITETNFVSAKQSAIDNSGNIYLILTRKTTGTKTKSSVAKYNSFFQKLWETDLYNNPEFGAAGKVIKLDATGNVFVAGETELAVEGGILLNSYTASLTNNGSIRWKKYLESSNSGTALIFDSNQNLLLLNMNCFIVNVLNPADGTSNIRKRMFSQCDPYNTDLFGSDFDISYDKYFLVAGSKGGNFYLALKTSL